MCPDRGSVLSSYEICQSKISRRTPIQGETPGHISELFRARFKTTIIRGKMLVFVVTDLTAELEGNLVEG